MASFYSYLTFVLIFSFSFRSISLIGELSQRDKTLQRNIHMIEWMVTIQPGQSLIFPYFSSVFSIILRLYLHTVTDSICTGTDASGAVDIDIFLRHTIGPCTGLKGPLRQAWNISLSFIGTILNCLFLEIQSLHSVLQCNQTITWGLLRHSLHL